MTVTVLAGGTGGAKLARGMLDVAGSELVVVANTADDVEVHGGYVSPDPDLVTFWLADLIDERGWGIRGDTSAVMQALRELGDDAWFELGDRDLALGLWRARRLAAGDRLTTITGDAARAYGIDGARVLPMCDEPVRTWVRSGGVERPFQEFMIRAGGKAGAPVEAMTLRGIQDARITPEVREAILTARAVIIGPSNPVISIGPILAVPGVRDALSRTPAPVVAVSPLVAGAVLKGPTEDFMRLLDHPLTAEGVAGVYDGLIDGLVADERAESVPTLVTDVLMADAAGRERLARETLEFALALGRSS